MRQDRRAEAGMTLVEIVIALAVIAIAIMAAVSLVMMGTSQDQAARERMLAMDRAKSVMEQIQQTAHDDVFTTFNGTAFDVDTLNALPGDPDGRVGRIIVDNTDPELLNITVLVEWEGMKGRTDLRFQSLLTRK